MDGATIAGIVRHLLTIVGGFFLSQMHLDAATLSAVAGAVATIVGVSWSVIAKQPVDVPAIVGTTEKTTTVKETNTVEPVGLIGKFNALPKTNATVTVTEISERTGKPKRKYIRKASSHANSRKK